MKPSPLRHGLLPPVGGAGGAHVAVGEDAGRVAVVGGATHHHGRGQRVVIRAGREPEEEEGGGRGRGREVAKGGVSEARSVSRREERRGSWGVPPFGVEGAPVAGHAAGDGGGPVGGRGLADAAPQADGAGPGGGGRGLLGAGRAPLPLVVAEGELVLEGDAVRGVLVLRRQAEQL